MSRPKTAKDEPPISPARLSSSMRRLPTQDSDYSDVATDEQLANDADALIRSSRRSPDQMDGVNDFGLTGSPCSKLCGDAKDNMATQGVNLATQCPPSLQPKSLFHQKEALINKYRQSNKLSMLESQQNSQTITDNQADAESGANKVRGLAAMFDSAAKASSFIPTPDGLVQRKRKEAARVVSPYMRNPIPRASCMQDTPLSAPVPLTECSRISITLEAPRGQYEQNHKIQTGHSLVAIGNLRQSEDRSTPSRLPIRKKASGPSSAPLPQFDCSFKPTRLTRRTGQKGYHFTPTPSSRTRNGYQVRSPFFSQDPPSNKIENQGISTASTSSSLSMRRSHNTTSLRDQIHNLKLALSAKAEDFAQLLFELEEVKSVEKVQQDQLRDDLDRAREDSEQWRRRAEKAEERVVELEWSNMHIEGAKGSRHSLLNRRTENNYSLNHGLAHVNSENYSAQKLTAKMNQSPRRTFASSPRNVSGADRVGDILSECSSSTVVRNISNKEAEIQEDRHWDETGEMHHFVPPELTGERF
ncbi:hypothetical protein BD289DRAFT_423281 [Coniella lustricola]|uniref:Uncharacterized protein n=1 Tax=Coniella lustricola TaxID=2025994 RepID=A0A2T3AJM2_9PEZI|nr:hypothetical protein BD289DRAFT_423281 [Coniella lustricola]